MVTTNQNNHDGITTLPEAAETAANHQQRQQQEYRDQQHPLPLAFFDTTITYQQQL